MFDAVRRRFDRFRGSGDHALSVPALDGAFRPNEALDRAKMIASLAEPDNITVAGGRLHLSSGGQVFVLEDGALTPVCTGGARVTALAGAPDGRLAIARSAAPLVIRDTAGAERTLEGSDAFGDVTGISFLPEGGLAVTTGGAGRRAAEWRRDLMEHGKSGSVLLIAPDGALRRIAAGLAWPNGVTPDGTGGLLVTLAWQAGVVRVTPDGAVHPVLGNLPGYPARIIAAAGGGFWLALFAPRNQLVELVLREDVYRRRMMAEIDPAYWVCPALTPASGPLEVMQDGAQKIGGAMKPWAPSLSGGMVLRIDARLLPQSSLHSRANGRNHGTTSLAETAEGLFVTTWGGGGVLCLPNGDQP